jgi:aspartate--ammonia ligase
VFIIGIGAKLKQGVPHDSRTADCDDWWTHSELGRPGLNGDLLVHYPVLCCALELSSMGVRVDRRSLRAQLKLRRESHKLRLAFHKRLLRGELPACIGGGIGQSRLCMLFLRQAHVGEVQSSIWPEPMTRACRRHGIELL